MSSTNDPGLDPKAQIANAATTLLSKVQSETSIADTAAALDKATTALRFIADSEMNALVREKIDQEIKKLKDENATMLVRQRWDGWRNIIVAITPILTIATFMIAQLVQNSQFNARQTFEAAQTEAKQQSDKDAMLEADLKKAVQDLDSDAGISPISVATFQRALDSPAHRESARDYVLAILKKTANAKLLDELFDRAFASTEGSSFGPSGKANFQRLVELNRDSLWKTTPIWDKWYRHKIHNEDPAVNPEDPGEISPAEQAQSTYNFIASTRIAATIGRILVSRSKDTPIDISGTYITSADWQDVNLEGADISGARIVRVNLKNANLAGISSFSDASLQETAWWEAKFIDSKLLDHLKATSPYNPNSRYGLELKPVSQANYEAELRKFTRTTS